MSNVIDFQVAFGAVRHFGRNLYTTNPPAITELVANAWDAYAKNCAIFRLGQGLVIYDDGIGMNLDELTNNYATSGNEKNTSNIRIPDDMISNPRKYMGRKGIGKFSAFSLGDEYQIITKSSDCSKWRQLTLDYEMLNANQAIVPVRINEFSSLEDYNDELGEKISGIADSSPELSGTVIYIPNLRREFTQATMNSLKKSLPRRFSSILMSDEINFNLYIDDMDKKVDLQKHFYYEKIENIYIFGFEVSERNEFLSKFTKLEQKGIKEVENEYLKENGVKGWIGSVETTSDLIENDIAVSGVSIYINGKIADTNIFRNMNDSSIPNTYLVGAVDADYLQTDETDPVLSSREGLNFEVTDVSQLRDELLLIKNRLKNEWNAFRRSKPDNKQDYMERILTDSKFNLLYENFNEDKKSEFKRLAQKVFDGNKNLDDLIPVYSGPLFTMVNDNELKKIRALSNGDDEYEMIDIITEFFESAEINYALRLKANFDNRLQIIEQLESFQDEEALEKAFQEHLWNNPWLLNPTWDIVPTDPENIEKRYSYLGMTNEEELGRIDIIICPKEEKNPVIVELKREKKTSYSCPNAGEIFIQIQNYRDAIYQNEPDAADNGEIKAFFICGTEAFKKLKNTQSGLQVLKNNDIELRTYQQLIDLAKKVYTAVE